MFSGPLQPNGSSSANSVMFTSPPLTLGANTSQAVSFPFKVPTSAYTGSYSVIATTLVNGAAVNTSTATLTITSQ